ncbi:hypothetical protein [uncultured Clostridium sp.]|uniref:hypothetical protein n=1 Tax=uncultured Clostridium sp. TaxID=59620 RepID=UPI00261E57EA|nr:hypothetical protein [uncultured Clostridium sp.]
MSVEKVLERSQYNQFVLDEFIKINSSVEILDVEPCDLDDTSVPADRGWWLKVTTKNHGWLHVYINKNTGELEWY